MNEQIKKVINQIIDMNPSEDFAYNLHTITQDEYTSITCFIHDKKVDNTRHCTVSSHLEEVEDILVQIMDTTAQMIHDRAEVRLQMIEDLGTRLGVKLHV